MNAVIAWAVIIAGFACVAGAVSALLRWFPEALENQKIRWSLYASGALIALVAVNGLFSPSGRSSDAADPEPRSWYRLKPKPTADEVTSAIQLSTTRINKDVETPNDPRPNRWMGCGLWRTVLEHKNRRDKSMVDHGIVLRWLGTCRWGAVHGTDTLVFLIKDYNNPSKSSEFIRVKLSVDKAQILNEQDFRDAMLRTIVERHQRAYTVDVRRVLSAQTAYVTYLSWSALIIAVSVLLSYAAAAGRWNNANYVLFSDWWGYPSMFAIGATQMWHFLPAGGVIPAGWIQAEAPVAIPLIAFVMFIAAIPCSLLYIVNVFMSIWALPSIVRGIAVFAHFFFYRHPVAAVLPDDPFARVDRRAIRKALVEAAYPDRSWLRSLVTPSFVHEHRMFAGARVEDMVARHAEVIGATLSRRRLAPA